MANGSRRRSIGQLLGYLWWAIGALAVLALLRGPGLRFLAAVDERGFGLTTILEFLQLLALAAVLVLVLVLVGRTVEGMLSASAPRRVPPPSRPAGDPHGDEGVAFPDPPTVVVGVWLGLMTVVFLFGLVESLAPMFFLTDRFPALACDSASGGCGDLHNLLVTMFAAGVGATITTILGFLDHASTLKDFKARFVPWYIARPLLGLLLGVVFYFVIKGGLLATVGSQNAEEIDVYGLAAFAALVGMFSKRAIEKLRDVFETLFATREDLRRQAALDEDDGGGDGGGTGGEGGDPDGGDGPDTPSGGGTDDPSIPSGTPGPGSPQRSTSTGGEGSTEGP